MNSTNSTSVESCTFPLAYIITVSTLLAITLLFSPILNLVVCITIYSSSKLHTFGNILITNLSIGDIIISLSLPLMEIIYVSMYPKWPTGKVGTYVLNSVWLFSLSAPFVTVTVMTFERFKTLKTFVPVTSKTHVTLTIFLIWLYNFGIISVMVYFFTEPGSDAYEWNVLPKFYYPFLSVHIVIPLIVIATLYIFIYRMARSSGRGAARDNASSAQLAKREMKVAKTVGIVIGLMFAIWIPAVILEYFYAIGTESCIVQMAGPVSVWLSCSNGLVNPLLYFYRNPVLRGEIVKKLPRLAKLFRLQKTGQIQAYAVNAPKAEINHGFKHCDQALSSAQCTDSTGNCFHIQDSAIAPSQVSDTKL